jgi:DNA polymerase III gamma/tau subunit
LYKKYRPRKLSDLVGNEEVRDQLLSMVKTKKVPHCILFAGPSGCGKTTLARIMGKKVGCSDGSLVEMNCSSFRGIDTIRDIGKLITLAPLSGTCRVWILDEFHQMSKDGQHAALKMLEDTPSHVYFFLCTTDPGKLLPTIRTRASLMEVRPLQDKELESLLGRIVDAEAIKLAPKVMDVLIDLSSGSARMALVLLDKIMHLPPKKQLRAMEKKAAEENEAIALCRALMDPGTSWKEIAGILLTLKGEPEATRWAVLGYARSALVKGWGDRVRAYNVLCAFEDNFFDSKDAGLARASFQATLSD